MAPTVTIVRTAKAVQGLYEVQGVLDDSDNVTNIRLLRGGDIVIAIPDEELDDFIAVVKVIPRPEA